MSRNTADVEVVGVVFDLSLRHSLNGIKHLDNVKTALIDFFRKNLEDDDIMYLYHPEIFETVNRIGAQVSAISNYQTDGWKFDLPLALKQTLFIIAAEPYESKKLLLFTDRLSDVSVLDRIDKLNKKDMFDCEITCFDIGCHLSQTDSVKIVNLENSDDLTSYTIKEKIYEANDIR